MRIMAVFEKGIRLRRIGHLDIQRAMMRALRRSGLPVAYSNGYNPHILLTFASALSTGAAGKKEILDLVVELRKNHGKTIVMISHDMNEVYEYASRFSE